MSTSLPQPNESNPSTPPRQSASVLPFGTIPIKPAPYAALRELHAAKAHELAGLALHSTAVEPDEFWMKTLETPDGYEAMELSNADLSILRRQYRKLAQLKKEHKHSESLSYVPTTIIMNVLSLAHAKTHPLPDDQVVGWFLNPTQLLFGDTFAKSLKPDIVAYLVARKTAEDYLGRLQSKTTLSSLGDLHLRPAWAQMISAADLKVRASGQSRLLNYLEAICCYRPDLVSVVAISSKLAGYQFYSLNAACCLKYAHILEWEDKNTPSLQKFIAAVYQTQTSRYNKMNYLQGSLQAWSLEGGSRRWDMLPFHTGHYPGRGTWVACAIDATDATEATEATNLSPGPEVHIVKIYWADAGSRWNEGDLYRAAHGESKIPGLARVVDHWKTGKVVSWSQKPGGPITSREQVCVILGSTGRPLNECKDVNEILGCIFDLLETLRVMCHRDVIHRDISWGNVMINPTHTNSVAGPVIDCLDEQRPWYISEVLKREMPGSLSLLTDLDCSAKLQDLKEDAKTGRHSRTGTPMFIAMEISSNVKWTPFPTNKECMAYFREMISPDPSCSRLGWLGQKVKQQLVHIWTASASASANFMQDLEDTLFTSEPKQEPPLVHAPRHDAESVFWLLWFLLARANPYGEAPVETEKVYDSFCSIMLDHTVGARIETRGPLAQMLIEQYRQTLHPRFAHLADMLYYMGSYFFIDPKTWSDYDTDHAYYFMQLLLLREMLRNEDPRKLLLNITRPRPATEPMALVRRLPVPVESRASHKYSVSLTHDNAVSCSVSSSGSSALKRKADTDAQGGPSHKRLHASSTVPAQLRRSSRMSSHRDHAGLVGAPQTAIQPEIVQTERNPFIPTPDRAEANEDGRATEDENEGKVLDPNVEQANYVESQETLETNQELEQEVFKKWFQRNNSLVRAFNAANDIRVSMLHGERWFTVLTE